MIENYQPYYSEDFCRYALWKVARGLWSMHRKNVLHRDIKSDNILFSRDGEVKITDLGFSVFLSEQNEFRKSKKGTPNWVAPEIYKGVRYSKSVDVWSFGCFAYELATGWPPFAHIAQRRQLIDNIINIDVPPIPDRWSASFKNFIKKCLTRDVAQRPTIQQCLYEDEFLSGLSGDDAERCKQAFVRDVRNFNASKNNN